MTLYVREICLQSGKAPDWQRLYERREDYPLGIVPAGGVYLTAGADVQKDRIEVESVAWGRGRESWSVDYRILQGSPLEPAPWAKLTALPNESFPNDSGASLSVGKLAVDTGGHHTAEACSWAARISPCSRPV